MAESEVTWGGLNCTIVDQLAAGKQPQALVILAHGFGAPGTDLVGLADALFQLEPQLAERVQFVFPAARLSLEEYGYPEGRAWWPLNLAQLQKDLALGRFEDVRQAVPPGLNETRAALTNLIDEASVATGVPASRCVLGGFSQGAMATMDAAVHRPEALAGLVLLSGAVVNETAWRAGAARHPELPVFQSHGRYDVVLPYIAGEWLRSVWTDAGNPVEFVPFDGGHQIPWPVLSNLARFLTRCTR